MKIVLIRHGETPGNALGQYIGRTDEPLSPAGIEQARCAGGDIALDAVYVTPLRRTQETAAILFPNAAQTVIPDLREMDFGDFEGRSAADMAEDADYRAWVEAWCVPPCPGGESKDGFAARVVPAFAEAVYTSERAGADRAVFVVHGGTIMAILATLARPERAFYEWHTKNCRGYVCETVPAEDGARVPFLLRDVQPLETIVL